MKKLQKLLTVLLLITAIATYIDIVAHQTDSMNGGRARHWLPTTRIITEQLHSR